MDPKICPNKKVNVLETIPYELSKVVAQHMCGPRLFGEDYPFCNNIRINQPRNSQSFNANSSGIKFIKILENLYS